MAQTTGLMYMQRPVRTGRHGKLTCAIVDASDLVVHTATSFDLTTYAYIIYGKPACSDEPFGSQPTAPFCTAFMVGEDLIATAGHCVDESDLSSVRFLFGFEMTDATTPILTFQQNQVYTGIEIVHHGGTGDLDHAIVRVDRVITAPGATALPIRRSGAVALGDRVGVIGHPYGLPKKLPLARPLWCVILLRMVISLPIWTPTVVIQVHRSLMPFQGLWKGFWCAELRTL